MKSYPSTRCFLFGAPTPYFRAVGGSKEEIKEADQRRKVRSDKTKDQSNNQEASNQRTNKIRINMEVKTQSA
jgi:hypothetical protein